MGVLSGPFKIVLQALERSSSPDTLGDPTAARVRSELARLFQLDEETASNIVSAMPIVIIDGLEVRTAGVVRDRLQVLRDAGCRVIVTDEVTDTIPRVNWPQLPPIARVEGSSDSGREPRPASHADGLSCPHCGGGLQLVTSGGAPRGAPPRGSNGREPEPEPAPASREREVRESAREPARSAPSRAEEDDWLSPPVGTSAVPVAHGGSAGAAPPSTAARRPSGRFDDAALLAYRRADHVDDRRLADPSPAAAATTLNTVASEVLEVSFSDSGELEPALAEQARRGGPARPEPAAAALGSAMPDPPPRSRVDPFEGPNDDEDEPSLLDSDDGFGEPPPARGRSSATAASRRPAETQRPAARSRSADPFEDSLAGLDAPAPAAASSSSSRADRSVDPFASQPPSRDPFASSPSRSGQASRSGVSDPFEDSRVLDDLSGLSGVGAGDLESDAGRDPLEDSGSDILDEPPPHRRQEPVGKRGGGDARFESDLDILDGAADLGASDELAPPPASAARRGAPAASSSRDLLDDGDDGLGLLDSDDRAPPPPSKRRGSSRGGRAPDLDDVLNMFGPEDDAPLDDGSGLEPAPLDLSPPGAGGRGAPKGRSGERGFDADLSDILEPLDPGEALEIIKTSKPGRRSLELGGPAPRGAQASRPSGAAANGRHDEPSGLEQLDISEAGAMLAESKQDRRSAKKSRGVPFPASDEDVGLFEESSRSGRPNKKKTDPFARARGRMQEEEERDRRSGADRAGADRAERDRGRAEARESATSDRPRTDPRGGAKRAAAGPAPTGDGDHGLVLSRIADPEKKEQAAEIIAEVKGCSLDEARRLTDRTIIPVLKGVSREVAEFHLEKFKRVKIAGRVTTRQRG